MRQHDDFRTPQKQPPQARRPSRILCTPSKGATPKSLCSPKSTWQWLKEAELHPAMTADIDSPVIRLLLESWTEYQGHVEIHGIEEVCGL